MNPRRTAILLICFAILLGIAWSMRRTLSITVEKLLPAHSVKIMIGGDIMLDRHIRELGQQNGYDGFFKDLSRLFASEDLVVANLEGPVTTSPSETLLSDGHTTDSFKFTFDPAAIPSLVKAGISMVSLANNHSDNFGYEGYLETQKHLDDSGLAYFGSAWNLPATEATTTIKSIPIALVGYHAFQGGFENILADIRRLKSQGYFVIVMPHWGIEYEPVHNDLQEEQAHDLVTAGADAIIGSHPHVVQDHEFTGNVPVFYSLGNLLFDQYFSPEVMKGLLVELTVTKKSDTISLDSVRTYDVSDTARTLITISATSTLITP